MDELKLKLKLKEVDIDRKKFDFIVLTSLCLSILVVILTILSVMTAITSGAVQLSPNTKLTIYICSIVVGLLFALILITAFTIWKEIYNLFEEKKDIIKNTD